MAAPEYVAHGEFAVGERDGDVIAATLGSCVSVCLWDPIARVGGMNHILLPGSNDQDEDRFGSADMERLINALLRRGAARTRLTAKVFGGASMLVGRTDIGSRNASFVLEYLERDGIPVVAKSTGGTQARQVKFFPQSGDVKHRLVAQDIQPIARQKVLTNDVELF